MERFNAHIIGIIHSCFKEKFGVPRQSGLTPSAEGEIELLGEYASLDAIQGLEQFSHLWICFVFHEHINVAWRPQVRPPRLGGNQYLGVFATRSGVRPNPIGWSVVRYHGHYTEGKKLFLRLSGIDVIEGTPILDIKPYIPYVDSIPHASAGYAQTSPNPVFSVEFSTDANYVFDQFRVQYPRLKQLITEVLSYDPRPAYYDTQTNKTNFGMRLYCFDIKWKVERDVATVERIGVVENCA